MKIKALLYCTKVKPFIMKYKDGKYKEIASFYNKQDLATYNLFNGKIAIVCDYEGDRLSNNNIYKDYVLEHNSELWENDILTKSCLTYDELNNYLSGNGYAIHIKNLHVFEEPRELSFYYQKYKNDKHLYNIEKAPKNMMRAIGKQGDDYILISVSPQEMCRIANKEQTVLVRRVVLKEMLK